MSSQNILEVKDLTKHFKVGRKQIVHAVDGVSFTLARGKTLGLVGESGCGKSTCARTVIRMYDPTAGQIILDGTDITDMKQKELKPLRKKMQMIFQDPYASLNARMTVRDIIAEPLLAHGIVRTKEESNELVYPMLEKVGLTKDDEAMVNFLVNEDLPFAVVCTKADKLNKTNRIKNLEAIRNHPAIPEDAEVIAFSSETGEGVDVLWEIINEFVDFVNGNPIEGLEDTEENL